MQIIIALVILGLILYLVDMLSIDGQIKRLIHIVAIVLAILYVLRIFIPLGFPF
jgi:hypothetical protein